MYVKYEGIRPPVGDDQLGHVLVEVIPHMPLVCLTARKLDFQVCRDPTLGWESRSGDRPVRWMARGSGTRELCDLYHLPEPSPELFAVLVNFHRRPDPFHLLNLVARDYPVTAVLAAWCRERLEAWRDWSVGPVLASPVPVRGLDYAPEPNSQSGYAPG